MPSNIKQLWDRVNGLPQRGANKTELKRMLQDEFFQRGENWQSSPLMRIMAKV
jgi:hypothetical protein